MFLSLDVWKRWMVFILFGNCVNYIVGLFIGYVRRWSFYVSLFIKVFVIYWVVFCGLYLISLGLSCLLFGLIFGDVIVFF